jgi:DNA primase
MEESKLQEIMERNNIVDVIGSYFPLKKSGNSYKARCPFHDEKTASFIVNEKKQIYKCFGCGKGGTVITFVRDYEKISFLEAAKKLAQRAGIPWNDSPQQKRKRTKRDLLYQVYDLATHFYANNLKSMGDAANAYLAKRELSAATIEKFELGYAPDSFGGLKNYLLKNSINDKIFEFTGLFGANQRGAYDFFRHRLMFPIHDYAGKVVAFSGRVLDADQPGGKYVNSPTTAIYTKGNELYGLFATRYEIGRKDYALIAEGNLDLLRLYECGFTHSVASLGTALTEAQVALLRRYTQNFYFLYDGDKAGRKAAVRAASTALAMGCNVRIVELPLNEDPDSFLKDQGVEALQQLIDEAKTLPAFLKNDTALNISDRAKIEQLIEVAGGMSDQLQRDLFLRGISEQFGIPEKTLRSRLKPATMTSTPQASQPQESHQHYEAERELIKLLLNHTSFVKNVAQQIDSSYFLTHVNREIFKVLLHNEEEPETLARLLNQDDTDEFPQIIITMMMEPVSEAENLDSFVTELKIRKYQAELTAVNKAIRTGEMHPDLIARKKSILDTLRSLGVKTVRKTLY